MTYLLDPERTREAVVTCKSPSDSRGRGKDCHGAKDVKDQKQGHKTSGESIRAQRLRKHLDERESRFAVESVWDVTDAEQDCHKHSKA